MTPEELPAWKSQSWHYCVHYRGIVNRAHCSAGVRFADVATTVRMPRGRPQTVYPCCLEWLGPDNCDRREIEQ